MAEPSTHINYSFEDIQRYLQGKMSAAEMHALEKAALQDPFLSDAIEGYREASSATAQQHLNEINAALRKAKQNSKVISIKRNNQWLRIAAIIIVLAGAGIITNYFFKTSNKKQQAAKIKTETNNNNPAKDSTATLTPKTTAVTIAQNKTKRNIHLSTKEKQSSANAYADTTAKNETAMAASAAQNNEAEKSFAPVVLSNQKIDSAQILMRSITTAKNFTVNTFEGKVVDENNRPVVGTMIETADKKEAAFADPNGNFVLQNNDSIVNVTANMVGYESKTALLQTGNKNRIVLQKNIDQLNEAAIVTAKPVATPVGGWENFNHYVMHSIK